MPHVEKTALVPFSAQAMFDLVADVEHYVDFLPWCSASELVSHDGDVLCGKIEVARMGIRQAFTTCNRIDPPRHMEIALKDGPFRRLHGAWEFIPLRDNACKIVLILDFEFSGRLIDAAFGRVFNQIANTLVESFCKRAKEVYDV